MHYQLNIHINMGVPIPDIEKVLFSDNASALITFEVLGFHQYWKRKRVNSCQKSANRELLIYCIRQRTRLYFNNKERT